MGFDILASDSSGGLLGLNKSGGNVAAQPIAPATPSYTTPTTTPSGSKPFYAPYQPSASSQITNMAQLVQREEEDGGITQPECEWMGGIWDPATNSCDTSGLDLDGMYPKSWSNSNSQSHSESSSYTGPADWAEGTFKYLVDQARKYADETWDYGMEKYQEVPELIATAKEEIPGRLLQVLTADLDNQDQAARNAYAARGLLGSSVEQAGRNDLRKAVMDDYNTAYLGTMVPLVQSEITHGENAITNALAGAQVAAQLAELGKISESHSLMDSLSAAFGGSSNPLALIMAILGMM